MPDRTAPHQTQAPTPTSTPTSTPGDESRERLRRALLRPGRSQVVVGVLLAAVGFAMVTQVRANELDDTYAGKRDQDLVDLLYSLSVAGQRAEAELARLERTRRDLQDANSRSEAALAQARQEADNLDILAGLVPVEGPGLRITITETSGPVPVDAVIDMIQELRTADAEAIEFNDEVRVVAQTSFDQGTTLVVDGEALTPPYVVDVIGAPRTLTEAMTFPDGPLEQLSKAGAVVDLAPQDEEDGILIESVKPPTRPEYAQPDEGLR